jgi:hypothetical protein
MPPRSARRKPPRTQSRRATAKREPLPAKYWEITHRPLQCLVFLLPMVLMYEVGMALLHPHMPYEERPDLAAKQLLYWFFSLFGARAFYLPGLVLVAVLISWHIACRYRWSVAWRPMAAMYGESVLLAIPMLLLNNWIPTAPTIAGRIGSHAAVLDELLLAVGAGIYEELLFRLIIITLLSMLFIDVLGMKTVTGVALVVIVSSLLFAAHHYPPIGRDPWSSASFAFRAAAGAYLAAVFVFRGFGLAVGSHVVYDVIATLL